MDFVRSVAWAGCWLLVAGTGCWCWLLVLVAGTGCWQLQKAATNGHLRRGFSTSSRN